MVVHDVFAARMDAYTDKNLRHRRVSDQLRECAEGGYEESAERIKGRKTI